MGANLYGNAWNMEDYSIYCTADAPKLVLPQEIVTQTHDRVRDSMIRQLKEYGLSDAKVLEIKSAR